MKQTKTSKKTTAKTTKSVAVEKKYNSFVDAIIKYWAGYIDFKGTSSRKEFWFAVLFLVLVDILFSVIGIKFLSALLTAIFFLPSRALAFRRYHDAGFSGLWNLIPYLTLFVWAGIRSDKWLFFLNLEFIPGDLKLFLLLGLVWSVFNLVILLKESKLKDNIYRK